MGELCVMAVAVWQQCEVDRKSNHGHNLVAL